MAETARVREGHAHVYAALDARVGEVYVAAYEFSDGRWIARIDATVIAPEAAPLPEAAGWQGAGPGFDAYPALRERLRAALRGVDASIEPCATSIGALAIPRLAAGEGRAAHDAAPLYVRHRVALTTAERGGCAFRERVLSESLVRAPPDSTLLWRPMRDADLATVAVIESERMSPGGPRVPSMRLRWRASIVERTMRSSAYGVRRRARRGASAQSDRGAAFAPQRNRAPAAAASSTTRSIARPALEVRVSNIAATALCA
jgi:hypothetical protein